MLDINLLKETVADFEDANQKRIEFERVGNFNQDQDDHSFEACYPVDENFDYLKRGLWSRLKHWIYLRVMNRYVKKINRELTNLQVVGRGNLCGLKSGYIVTCNHISKVDSFAVRAAIKRDLKFVAADFNNWKGPMGDIARNTGYLPIASNLNLAVMRKFNHAMEYFLQRKWPILIYPEQAMWREYKKPRPLKKGAFHYAAKYHCPVVPLFITIQDKPERVDVNGRVNFGDYTIHILPPIYPRADLDERGNTQAMMDANFEAWRRCYEDTYGLPLEYDTTVTADMDPVIQRFAKKSKA